MSKKKLFLDFDGTIVASIEAFCKTYNYLYKNHPDFKPACWWLVDQWNFSNQCPLLEGKDEKVEKIFENELFFKYLDFLNGNTYEILQELCNKYEIIIATIGTFRNVSLKALWIKKHLPFIKECIFITNNGCKMDKSIVNMEGAIFIDDTTSNLNSSNANIKICIGDKYSWNENWTGIRCVNWTDVYKILK